MTKKTRDRAAAAEEIKPETFARSDFEVRPNEFYQAYWKDMPEYEVRRLFALRYCRQPKRIWTAGSVILAGPISEDR